MLFQHGKAFYFKTCPCPDFCLKLTIDRFLKMFMKSSCLWSLGKEKISCTDCSCVSHSSSVISAEQILQDLLNTCYAKCDLYVLVLGIVLFQCKILIKGCFDLTNRIIWSVHTNLSLIPGRRSCFNLITCKW